MNHHPNHNVGGGVVQCCKHGGSREIHWIEMSVFHKIGLQSKSWGTWPHNSKDGDEEAELVFSGRHSWSFFNSCLHPFANDSSVHWFTGGSFTLFYNFGHQYGFWTAINMDPAWHSIWELESASQCIWSNFSSLLLQLFLQSFDNWFSGATRLYDQVFQCLAMPTSHDLDFQRSVNIDMCCADLHEFSIISVPSNLTIGRYLKCADYVDRFTSHAPQEKPSLWKMQYR